MSVIRRSPKEIIHLRSVVTCTYITSLCRTRIALHNHVLKLGVRLAATNLCSWISLNGYANLHDEDVMATVVDDSSETNRPGRHGDAARIFKQGEKVVTTERTRKTCRRQTQTRDIPHA